MSGAPYKSAKERGGALSTVSVFNHKTAPMSCLQKLDVHKTSLSPRASITANTVQGLVKLLRRMTLGGLFEAWHFRPLPKTTTIAPIAHLY